MSTSAAAQVVVDRIERVVQTEVGRNIGALCEAARGGLWRAASALAAPQSCRVGLITGFFVPLGSPPAAETDGPVGAALLARGLAEIGIPCRLATDEPCRNACAVALGAAGVPEAPVDAVAVDAPLAPLIETWRAAGITHAMSIERCGRSADGSPRNMRGEDISAHTAALDDLFTAGPWDTIAIGDGGNEIGMGALPRGTDRAPCRAWRDDRVRDSGASADRGWRVALGRLCAARGARGRSHGLAGQAIALSR